MINKTLAILGSSGSIGTQALDVCRMHKISVEAISVNTDITRAKEQIREFKPKFCAVTDEKSAKELEIAVKDTNTKIFAGTDGLLDMITHLECDTVLNSVIGGAGLMPTVVAVSEGKNIALANKETLVCAGEYIMKEVKRKNLSLLPVDSEHCAIFQCLMNGSQNEVSRLILTASGGPFFGFDRASLENVTVEQTLAHPTWKMGKKITVDSASLMNKCFEMMEASYLFDVDASKIDVVVHRESFVHSMVEYVDGAIIAQMSPPDMRMCIQYALTYPERMEGCNPRADFSKISKLTFFEPDVKTFKPLSLAPYALKAGGIIPAVLNGVNDAAVKMFLERKIKFTDIMDLSEEIVHNYKNIENPDIDCIVNAGKDAYALAHKLAGVSCEVAY